MGRRHVLIGSGPAALAAAEAIRSRDKDADIVIVGAESNGYYSRPGLAYYLAKEVPEDLLFPLTAQDIARLNVRWITGRVVHIDAAARTVVLDDGRELPYDRLLVATGSLASPINVPGAELDGVVKLDDMDDARDLIRRARDAKAAVIVGGGSTALEIVEGLRIRHVPVHYFIRKERYWSNVLSVSESAIVEAGLRERGVQIHDFTKLVRILGDGGRVAAVETDNGKRIPCDLVAVAIGVVPQKQLGEAAGLACARGILVDGHLCTSEPDIFAAGDVAEVRDERSRGGELEVLWSSAVAKGRIAGLNMAAEPAHSYNSGTALNVTRLAGYKITIMGAVGSGKDSDLDGLSRGDSETWRDSREAVTVESQSDEGHLRLALEGGAIAGAVVMGDQAISFPLQDLIEAGVDVSRVAASLQTPNAPVTEIVRDFWLEWKGHLA